MCVYSVAVSVADPAPKLGRFAPSDRLGSRRSSATPAALRCAGCLGSAGLGVPVLLRRTTRAIASCSPRLLAAAPPRGSAALGTWAQNWLGLVGEVRLVVGASSSLLAALRARKPHLDHSRPPAPRHAPPSNRREHLSEAVRALLSDFQAAAAPPDGYRPVRPSTALLRPQAADPRGLTASVLVGPRRSRSGRPAPNVSDTTAKKALSICVAAAVVGGLDQAARRGETASSPRSEPDGDRGEGSATRY